MNPSLPSTAALTPALKPLRALYADDVLQLRELMAMILRREGHALESVENGLEALTRLTANPTAFDLLITDHHMPKLNGLDLVRKVRELGFGGKIIVFSSELSSAVDQEYRRLGVDLILPKPVFPLTFRLMLRQLFPAHYPPPTDAAAPT